MREEAVLLIGLGRKDWRWIVSVLDFSMVWPMIARWLTLYRTAIALMGRAAQVEAECGLVRRSGMQCVGRFGGMNYKDEIERK